MNVCTHQTLSVTSSWFLSWLHPTGRNDVIKSSWGKQAGAPSSCRSQTKKGSRTRSEGTMKRMRVMRVEVKTGRGGERKRDRGGMSGMLPACRSNVKNDVCGCQVRMDPLLHRRRSITFPTDTSYVRSNAAAVHHLRKHGGCVRELPLKSSSSEI